MNRRFHILTAATLSILTIPSRQLQADAPPSVDLTVGNAAITSDSMDERLLNGRLVDWCRTSTTHPANTVAGGDQCPIAGACDVPSYRNVSIPSADKDFLTIRIRIHVFANDNGSGLTATQTDVDAQLAELNANYEPLRIRFVSTNEQVNNTQFRNYTDADNIPMKNTYADDPAHQCNIYVVSNGGFAFGTFPWDPIALTNLGGIVIDQSMFGLSGFGTHRILSHEMGHCLGLWHTHHGVSEVGDCTPCYELADGSNGNVAGDFAGDTPPTPVNFSCNPPGGGDCQGTPWGSTSIQNYMGYAADSCYTEFTPHQWGRMQCWTRSAMHSWAVDCNGNGVDDQQDVLSGTSQDCNFNLNPDECEIDCNSNGQSDACEFAGAPDCNNNGVPDGCDSDWDVDGTIDDCDDDIDNDGVLNDEDHCNFTPLGVPVRSIGVQINDTDGDCDIDLTDYKRFRPCFSSGGPGSDASNNCQALFDSDLDDNIDLWDFAQLQIYFSGS